MVFTYPEDEAFFRALLCDDHDDLGRYLVLFDFRLPDVKRREFNNRRARLLETLITEYGAVCQLQ